jgi:DNA-binding CsgD family transcriptional regulator
VAVGGGCAATLHMTDLENPRLLSVTGYGIPEGLVEDHPHWAAQCPRTAHGRTVPHGGLMIDYDFTTERDMSRSGYYEDHLRQFDWRYLIASQLHASDSKVQAAFTLQRSPRQGPPGPDEVQLVRLLTPHLDRALRLNTRIAESGALGTVGLETLERLDIGIALLDGHGRRRFANAALQAMGAERDGITLSGDSLRFGGLHRHIGVERAIGAALGKTGDVPRSGEAQVPRPSGRRPYLVTVAPVPRSPALHLPAMPAAIVQVTDAERTPRPPLERLRRTYRLTPRETALVAALLRGLTLKAAADELGMAAPTARAHLTAVFAKTGTTRQVELLQLLARLGMA